jgi:2-polyprenyl-6-methoxyphenol hydroxylase-like FAD-dependent oxidoreductase
LLAQQGVACRLIDQLPQPVNDSRAAAIHARTCELLERLGVIDRFLAVGVKVHGIHVMDQTGKTLLRNNLDGLPTAYNFILGLGQHQTEQLLTEELARRGVTVERAVTLTALSQTPEEVNATLVHGGRSASPRRGCWVATAARARCGASSGSPWMVIRSTCIG